MKPKTLALFVTCLVDQVMPEVGIATVTLLERFGYAVDFPQAQTCCGQPFYNSGFQKEALKLAQKTIEILEAYETIVIPSGSCAAMIRVEYPHLLAGDAGWRRRALAVAGKTFELSEFLVNEGLALQGSGNGTTVTYHDSCHMCRLLGIREAPREMLRQTGHGLSEMQEADRCCGFGGLFFLKMPEVSGAMTAEKLRQARETGADLLVTSDPGCLMQLRAQSDSQPGGLRVEHLAVQLERSTR